MSTTMEEKVAATIGRRKGTPPPTGDMVTVVELKSPPDRVKPEPLMKNPGCPSVNRFWAED